MRKHLTIAALILLTGMVAWAEEPATSEAVTIEPEEVAAACIPSEEDVQDL